MDVFLGRFTKPGVSFVFFFPFSSFADFFFCLTFTVACVLHVWGGKVGSMFSGPKPLWVQLSQIVTLL